MLFARASSRRFVSPSIRTEKSLSSLVRNCAHLHTISIGTLVPMAESFHHGRRTDSVFQLLGTSENGMSASVGWALANAPQFLARVVSQLLGTPVDCAGAEVRLQQRDGTNGITDIEIVVGEQAHLILEAKRFWELPVQEQLEKYATRSRFSPHAAAQKRLVTVSNYTAEAARQHRAKDGCEMVGGVQVTHLSWKDIYDCSRAASRSGTHAERRLLAELGIYLKGLIRMGNADSNWVYVVSLGAGTPDGWGLSWKEIVASRRRYFHPLAAGWPKEPPNYLAFRFDGRLQSIHHVESTEMMTNPNRHFPEIPDTHWDPFLLYSLGPPFAPAAEVRTGNIYPSGRVKCMLDTLFTSATIAEARDESARRQQESESAL